MPLDPARAWLAAGITGIARGRERRRVCLARLQHEAAVFERHERELVPCPVRANRRDGVPFAAALSESISPPYRALAVRRPGLWAVGAVRIDVQRLDPDPRGDDLQLSWNGAELVLRTDGVPADPAHATALERVAAARVRGPYAAHARRLDGELWEVSVLTL